MRPLFIYFIIFNGFKWHYMPLSLNTPSTKIVFGENTMTARTLIQLENPTTQSIDSVKSLLAYVGRASDPLPTDVSLESGRVVLILSNKKDCYYVATQKACSCPSAAYRPGQSCKHQRKFFAEVKAATKPQASEPLIKRGGFKPFDELPGERASSSLSAIDCHDMGVAYHSVREDKIMWPVEA